MGSVCRGGGDKDVWCGLGVLGAMRAFAMSCRVGGGFCDARSIGMWHMKAVYGPLEKCFSIGVAAACLGFPASRPHLAPGVVGVELAQHFLVQLHLARRGSGCRAAPASTLKHSRAPKPRTHLQAPTSRSGPLRHMSCSEHFRTLHVLLAACTG